MLTESDKRQNRRTALILLSVVVVFFIGVVLRHWLYGS
jgi:predicted nucleic acid-binding Zn ribbon protein